MSDINEPPRKGQMVFINKSQSSKHLSRSEGDERSRIFSQAQSSQAQQKVQKQISYESDAASGSSSESRERVLRRQGSGNVSKRSKTLMLRPRRAMIAQQRKRQSSSPSSAQAGDQSTIPFSEDFRMLSAPRESMADYYMNVLIMFCKYQDRLCQLWLLTNIQIMIQNFQVSSCQGTCCKFHGCKLLHLPSRVHSCSILSSVQRRQQFIFKPLIPIIVSARLILRVRPSRKSDTHLPKSKRLVRWRQLCTVFLCCCGLK